MGSRIKWEMVKGSAMVLNFSGSLERCKSTMLNEQATTKKQIMGANQLKDAECTCGRGK